jgi:plastocyanin
VPRWLLLVLAPLGVLAACGGADEAAPAPSAPVADADAVVTIKNFHFGPDPITVDVGTTVTFRNDDKIRHRVIAGTREAPRPEGFSGVVDHDGDTFELTIDEPGNYAYYCELHPGEGMTGLLIVQR